MFTSTELATRLQAIIKAMGKTAIKKARVTLSLNTNATSVIVTGDGVQINFSVSDAYSHAASACYELSDMAGILDLDKKRFDLDLDANTLNDLPLFACQGAIIEVGHKDRTVEFDDMATFSAKDVLPGIRKLLKKSMLRESEYLLWRVEPTQVQLCQVFPTEWGVRFTHDGDYGATLNFYTNKAEIKLLTDLLAGRFKASTVDGGLVVEDSSYSIYFRQVALNPELYPPFD